jgi:hypothetical protein
MHLLAANVAQQAARMAEEGDVEEAQAYSRVQARMMSSNVRSAQDARVMSKWVSHMDQFDGSLGATRSRMTVRASATASRDVAGGLDDALAGPAPSGSFLAPPRPGAAAPHRAEKKIIAKAARSDEAYEAVAQSKRSSSTSFI